MESQHTLPPEHPADLMDAIWPVIQPLLTPGTVGAMALTIAVTHVVKLLGESLGTVDNTRDRWVAFCTLASVISGTLVGTLAWHRGMEWEIIPLCAFGSGLVWRALQALFPKVGDILITSTDRKFRGAE